MGKVILNNTEKEISGFYYDIQRKNPMMRVTLHANTKPPQEPFSPWNPWSSKNSAENLSSFLYFDKNLIDQDEPEKPVNIPFVIDNVAQNIDVRYGAIPICSSIINEDFNVSIANTWADFAGGTQIEDLFNQYKTFEPYATKAAPLIKNLVGNGLDYLDKAPDTSIWKNDFTRTAFNALGSLGGALGNKGNQLSRSLVVQGTRFKYYSGTGIAFSNLGMKFTLFADYVEELDQEKIDGSDLGRINYTGRYKFKTPDQQLETLLPYSVGTYTKFIKEGSITDTSNKKVFKWGEKEFSVSEIIKKVFGREENGETIIPTGDEVEQTLNTYLGWQLAPGGFRASIDYVDSVQTGTLMLKIGPYYRLKNLVVQDIQLNYSKHMAKYFDKDTETIKTCPLYCEVTITLQPANKYSDQMLKEFVMSRSSNISNSIKNLEETINTNIGLK